MKRLRRIQAASAPVVAAENDRPALDEAIDKLEEDFSYVVAGLEKLGRDGVNASNAALAIAEKIQGTLQTYVSEIANAVTKTN